MDSDIEDLQSPRLGTIEESSLENLILQYEEEVKELRLKLAQAKSPSLVVTERGYLPKQRKALEQVSDLLAFGDLDEAARLWREVGFPPMEGERWEDVYKQLQSICTFESQRSDQQLTALQAQNFKLETEVRSLHRSLREAEQEAETLRQNLPPSKRSQDPAEVIVLRMQIKALEDGIAARDKDIGDLATEVQLLRAEEQRLRLVVENQQIEVDLVARPESVGEFHNLLRKIDALTAENIALARRAEEGQRLEEVVEEQNRVIEELREDTREPTPGVSDTLREKVQQLEDENDLEKQARTDVIAKLQETIRQLEATHSDETLRLTKQLTVTEGLSMQANMRVHELEQQLTELLSKLSENEREIYTDQARIEELEEEKESLRAEFERASRGVLDTKQQLTAALEEVKQTTVRYDTVNREYEEMQGECEALRAQVAEFRLKNSSLESDLREAELKLDQQVSAKLSEISEMRKSWETERRHLDDKQRSLQSAQSALEGEIASLKREKEEMRIDRDVVGKKMEVVEDDYVRLRAAYESLQRVAKSQSETAQQELSTLKEELRKANVERQVLESRISVLEESRDLYEKLTVEHSMLESEHLKCDSKLLKLQLEMESEQEEEAKRRETVSKELAAMTAKYQYVLNAYRVRETELVSLRVANEQEKGGKSGGEGKLRRRNSASRSDSRDREVQYLQGILKSQESTIAELQQRLISLMSSRPEHDGKTHTQLLASFPEETMSYSDRELIAGVQKAVAECVSSLPDWVKQRLPSNHVDVFIEASNSVEEFLSALRSQLTEMVESISEKDSPGLGFSTAKAANLLDRLDRGGGPIDSAIFLNFLIENRLLYKELLQKAEEVAESAAATKLRDRNCEESELWAIRRWHEAEKEAVRLRTEFAANLQRFEDFYRSREGDTPSKRQEDTQKLQEELLSVQSSLVKSQQRVKELEGRLAAGQTIEAQKGTYETVISTLRAQLAKSEGETEALQSAWDRVLVNLKHELIDFGGEYQPSSKDSQETVLLGIIAAFKSVRLGLNQRISDLEKRLASLAAERDSFRIEKSALERAREESRQEADRYRSESRQLRLRLESLQSQPKSPDDSKATELELSSRVQAACTLLRGELGEAKVALAASMQKVATLESRLQAITTENESLKSSEVTRDQNLLKDLQSKTDLIEKLVSDNENTKQRYHRKELQWLELLSEKDEELKRSQLETVQLTTASWSFRRRSRGEEKGPTHKQVS